MQTLHKEAPIGAQSKRCRAAVRIVLASGAPFLWGSLFDQTWLNSFVTFY